MINCPSCEYADFDKDKCTRLLIRLPHICPYAVERKPHNHFEMVKIMSMEQIAEWLDAVSKAWYDDGYTKETDEPLMSPYPSTASKWLDWLKEEVKE